MATLARGPTVIDQAELVIDQAELGIDEAELGHNVPRMLTRAAAGGDERA